MRSVLFSSAFVALFHVSAVSVWAQGAPAADGRASIDRLIQLLQDKDAGVRADAADSLAEMGKVATPAVSALVKALDDPDEDVRMHARDALVSIGDPAIPILTDVVTKGPIRKRLLALIAVAGIALGPPRQQVFKDLLPVLLKCIKDKNPDIRAMAVHCLKVIGDESCIPRLIKLLKKDKNVEVRYEVLQAFIAFGEKAVAAMPLLAQIVVRDYDTHYEGLTTLGEQAAAALSSIREPALPVLASIVADRKLKSAIRRTALFALWNMGGHPKFETIAPVLCRALTDRNEMIRFYAALILSRLNSADDSVRAALLAATADKSLGVRMEAAVSLSRFDPKNPRVLLTIIPALDDRDAEVRRSACFKLGEIGARGATAAIPKLIELVNDWDFKVRLIAINALLIMADEGANISAAIPTLMIATKDPSQAIRKAAQDCLKIAKR